MTKDFDWELVVTAVSGLIFAATTYINNKNKQKETEKPDIQKEMIQYPEKLRASIDAYKIRILDSIKTGDPGRDLLAKEYFCFRINALIRQITKVKILLESCDKTCLDTNCSILKTSLLDCYRDFLERAYHIGAVEPLSAFTTNRYYTHEDFTVLKIWCDKYKERALTKEAIVLDSIDAIDSVNEERCMESLEAIYNTVLNNLRLVVKEASDVSKQLNGELTGKKFLGLTIGDVPH